MMGNNTFKKLCAFALSVPIGLGITWGVLWLFGIAIMPLERWQSFPDNWRLFELITNAMALLMVFGTVRAAYRVLLDVWISDKPAPSDGSD